MGDKDEATPSSADQETTDAPNEAVDPAAEQTPPGDAPATETAESTKDKTFWYWVAGIVLILCLELFIYGYNGEIEVCVGIEGVTQWELKDQPKSPETFRKAPICSLRMNLGMYGGNEEQSQAALQDACSRATISNRNALPDCIRRDKKWTRQVYKKQVPPWDERFYRRLLWID